MMVVPTVLIGFLPTYLSTIIKHPIHDALAINTFSMVVLLFTIPLAGYISDIVGQRKLMILATAVMLFSVLPLFMLLKQGGWYMALAAQMLFAFIVGFLQGPMPSLMAEMFPVKIRYTSIGIGYNFSVALLGGTAPVIATWLIEKTDNLLSPAFYIMCFAVVSLAALIAYRPN